MAAVTELASEVGASAACQALCMPRLLTIGIAVRSLFLRRTASRPSPARALCRWNGKRSWLVCTKNASRIARQPLFMRRCSMKGNISAHPQYVSFAREARGVPRTSRSVEHPPYKKPELLATAPNQLWSWDISKLLGPMKWTYFYLYVILDVFSRYVTGWMVAMRESAELAKRLIAESCQKQRIQPGQLTLHADRGTSMSSKPVAFLLADLGVTKTHSRPHVSNDNPYSESQFRTLKYRPEFPDRFGCIQDSRAFCQGFFRWYNGEHRHSGLGLLTPAMVHYNQTDLVIQQRQQVLDAAYQLHPERFVRSAQDHRPSPRRPGSTNHSRSHEMLTKFREHVSQVVSNLSDKVGPEGKSEILKHYNRAACTSGQKCERRGGTISPGHTRSGFTMRSFNLLAGSDDAEGPVTVVVVAGGEEELIRIAVGASHATLAELNGPDIVDFDGFAARVAERPQESARLGVKRVDAPARSVVGNQQRIAQESKIVRGQRDAPRRMERTVDINVRNQSARGREGGDKTTLRFVEGRVRDPNRLGAIRSGDGLNAVGCEFLRNVGVDESVRAKVEGFEIGIENVDPAIRPVIGGVKHFRLLSEER